MTSRASSSPKFRRPLRLIRHLCALALTGVFWSGAQAQDSSRGAPFTLPQQAAPDALMELATKARFELQMDPEPLKLIMTHAVSDAPDVQSALAIMCDGTPIRYQLDLQRRKIVIEDLTEQMSMHKQKTDGQHETHRGPRNPFADPHEQGTRSSNTAVAPETVSRETANHGDLLGSEAGG